MNSKTISLVLETNNLKGGAAKRARITESLGRLLIHLESQTFPMDQLQELVITHDGLSDSEQAELCLKTSAALRFKKIPEDVGYYQAKNIGFDATVADVVAFADADCLPRPTWLQRLVAPIVQGEAKVVAGRTTYRDDLLGVAATTIDFMYFDNPERPGCVLNFYANNVAFERTVFDERRYPDAAGMYRGHCQKLGLQLRQDGVGIYFEPAARTIHRFPDHLHELFRLRVLRGRDLSVLAPHIVDTYAKDIPAGELLTPLMRPISPGLVLGSRLLCSLRSLGRQDMPEVKGPKAMVARGAIAGISALDAMGAALGLSGMVDRAGRFDAEALSYHKA